MEVERCALKYNPRWYQICVHNAFNKKGYKRVFALFHRRAGKDICAFNHIVDKANQGIPGLYYYICPTYQQGKKIIWTGINEDGQRIIDYIPKRLIKRINNSEMLIEFRNGSLLQVVGCDNYDSLRGTNPRGVVFSEYAMMDERIWTEVISPILRKNGGWAFFQTTPLGRNHAYDLWNQSNENEKWYTLKVTVDDTGLITEEQINEERDEGKEEPTIQQEYYCSFSKGLMGAYYQELIDKMHQSGRITDVPWNPNEPVYCSFDLGMTDSTAIIWYQYCGRQVHFIDAEEHSNKSIQFYAKLLLDKPYVYGGYFFPHDLAVKELGTGVSRDEVFRNYGIEPYILPRKSIQGGIENARSLLMSKAWIDKDKCKTLIKCLEHYHREYDSKNKVLRDKPKHDFSSHFADSFRYAAMSIVDGLSGEVTATRDRYRLLRNQHKIIA